MSAGVCRNDSITLVSKRDVPLAGVRTIDEIVSESLAIDRFSVLLFASFGVLDLMLAVVGIQAAFDLRAFGAVFVLLLISSCLACLLHALRASRVEPLVALRDN
jgi:ABC-type lipoprotein release transport system permease subunit